MDNGSFTASLTVGVLVELRYLRQRQPAGLCAELRRRGHGLRLVDAEQLCRVGSTDWLADVDVLVPRGRSIGLLASLKCAEYNGVPVVNTRRAIGSVHNKIDMTVALVAAGIPTPETYAASLEQLLHAVPAGSYPLVLKPTFGDNGNGLAVAPDPVQLASLSWREPIALAQRLVPNDGFDLKLYVIGSDVWAVRKPSPMAAARDRGRSPVPVEPTPELAALARRCGRLFGLELYGVDCIETADGPLVLEVNEFPNYTGVAEADERIADLVERRAAR